MKFVLWALLQSPNNSKTNFDWLLFSPILLLRRWKRWLKLSPKFVPSLKKLLWNSDNCCPIAFCHFEMQSNPNCLEITGERGLNWTTWCSRLRLGTVLDILQQWWSSGKVLRRVKGGKKNVLLSEVTYYFLWLYSETVCLFQDELHFFFDILQINGSILIAYEREKTDWFKTNFILLIKIVRCKISFIYFSHGEFKA